MNCHLDTKTSVHTETTPVEAVASRMVTMRVDPAEGSASRPRRLGGRSRIERLRRLFENVAKPR